MNTVMILICGYLLLVNILGFSLMGIDKKRAIKRAFRIPELNLFAIALIGGALGSTIGMHFFHHKTRHWYFLYGMPAILALHLIFILILCLGPFEIVFL